MITPWKHTLPESGSAAVEVVSTLQKHGHSAYLVGGAVRDQLLGRKPGDWDVATDAVPEKVLEIFPHALQVGVSFGVVIVGIGEARIETATFRRDGSYLDGRRPDHVEFTTDPHQDAQRRDFTINALYLDPVAGSLLDPVGGVKDAKDGILRAVGVPTERFHEDGLRLMRAARFVADLGCSIHKGTSDGMRDAAATIDKIAAERIGDETVRLLLTRKPSQGFELLRTTGVLERIMPEVAALHGVAQPPDHHPEGCVWTHTMKLLDLANSPSAVLAMAALLHDVGKPSVQIHNKGRIRFPGHARRGMEISIQLLSRLRRPMRMSQAVSRMVDRHMQFYDAPQMRDATLKRFLAQENFAELLELHRLDRLAGSGDLDTWEFCCQKLEELSEEELHPTPLLTGRDLIRLGYPRGPLIGVIMEEQQTAQLEVEVTDKASVLAWLSRRFPLPK